jgi:hypothetical protein
MELWEASPDGGEPRVVFRFRDTPIGGAGMATDASPDGGRLAVVASGNRLWPTADVYILDRSGESVETIWEDHPDDRKDARALWSPNGRQIAWHHNFTRGALAETFYYGVGLASLKSDGRWRCRLQPNRAELVTPLAWTPSGSHLLCARMTRDESRATLFLMDCQFQTTRELFQLEVYGWRPGHREFGRLADWAVVPDDIPLGSLSGTGGSRGE